MADPLARYDSLFQAAGAEWDIDPTLLKAMARTESGGNVRARSPAGAQGLMQIIPDTQTHLGVTDPYDAAQSIYGAAKYMAEARAAEGDNPHAALLYYHGGADWRQAYGPESAAYVPKVAAAYQGYAKAPAPAAAPANGGGKMTDDEFLKEIGKSAASPADAKKPALPSDADFLKELNANAAAPSPAASLKGYTPESTDPPDETPDPRVLAGINRIAGAAAEGWRNTPNPLMTPKLQQIIEQGGPIGNYITSPLLQAGGNLLSAGAAGFRGVQQALVEAGGGDAGPGRDFAAFMEAAPMLPREVPMMPRANPLESPPPRFVQEHYGEGLPGNPLAAAPAPETPAFIPPEHALLPPRQPETPAFIPPQTRPFGPGSEGTPAAIAARSDANLPPAASVAPAGTDQQWLSGLQRDVQQVMRENGVNDLSAATTPEAQAKMTPAQMKANRRMAELKEVLSPPMSGEDNVIHIPGSEPTLAERAGDPVKSQLETVLRARKPDDFEPRLSANSEARINAFDDKAGTDPQLVTLDEQQKLAAERDTALIMRTAQPADLAPAVTYLDGLLNNARIAERDDVVAVLKPLREKLYDKDGNLKTDPQAVWGMHDNLMALLAKAKDPLKATGAEKFAFSQLNGFKQIVDAVMNKATDGNFQTFLDNQAKFFQEKNAMEVLQKFRTGMVDPKTGHIYANKFHRWLVDLAVRRGKPGVDPAMDIPDATMRTLMDIDNDLKRSSRIDLGKARGSPTNLFFEVAKAAGIAGAHTIAGLTTGGVGNFVIQQAIPGVTNWRLNYLAKQHLAPPATGFRPNPLSQDAP